MNHIYLYRNLLTEWHSYLNGSTPTVAFSSVDNKPAASIELLKRAQELCKGKENVKICAIGYPNLGKKSVVSALNNFLLNDPTKEEFKNIKVLETVGVVFGQNETNAITIKNVTDPDDLSDPYVSVHSIIKKADKNDILLLYEIAEYANTQEFLANVAAKKGFALKGGIPDYDITAKTVLRDWISGKIRYYEECPAKDKSVCISHSNHVI